MGNKNEENPFSLEDDIENFNYHKDLSPSHSELSGIFMPDLSISASSNNGKVKIADFGTASSMNTSEILKLFNSRLEKNSYPELRSIKERILIKLF